MKQNAGYVFFALIAVCSFSLSAASNLAEGGPKPKNGMKWRIGYYEGGPFSDYTETMRTFVQGLIEAGWIKDDDPPELVGEMPKPYWDWLVECDSPFLSFSAENAYSAEWDENRRSRIRENMLEKLRAAELDLVIAMGTWAGLDLATDRHSVPTMVMSTSDPVKAGIVASAENSGLDHVTARVDPTRYLRQIRMFHRIVGFETMGVAYENTPDGRVYSALEDIDRIARERGFRVVLCEVEDTTADVAKSDRSCLDCYRKLARQTDAVYVTALACVDRNAKEIAEIFRQEATPSFAMVSSNFVEKGIMLSISSDSGYKELGRYNAMKFGKILDGVKPSLLPQLFEDPLDIAVNMETVRRTGFDMPESIRSIAAEIFEK